MSSIENINTEINLATYNAFAEVPDNAKKEIGAGRLKGMTDINPMWRIKMLTERYGPCGIGWTYEITDKRVIEGADGVVCAFLDILLYVKEQGEWSKGIPGTGGSQLVSKETKGLYTNDECFKMALTDAISVACKALGMGANVYWQSGRTKYDLAKDEKKDEVPDKADTTKLLTARELLIQKLMANGIDFNAYAAEHGLSKETTEETYRKLLAEFKE